MRRHRHLDAELLRQAFEIARAIGAERLAAPPRRDPDQIERHPIELHTELVEFGADSEAALDELVARAEGILATRSPIRPPDFTRDPHRIEVAWTVREGLHGLIGRLRPPGTALIIEDVCVPPARIAESARDIFSKYLTADLPLHAEDLAEFHGSRDECVGGMIRATVERMYSETEENRFLEVTYANGDKEILYFKDFNSGAMIQNIVDRAKKLAIKDFLTTGQKGIRVEHILASCVDEFKENEDLPNTTNPDDWARISGKKGERIVYIRTLIKGKDGTEPGRSIATANTGQYL